MKPSLRRLRESGALTKVGKLGDKAHDAMQTAGGIRVARAGGNHLAYLQSIRDESLKMTTDDIIAKIKEHKRECSGCTAGIIEEIRAKLPGGGE